eukprot:3000595-Ditylum_brightwellii.AAC.1
MAEAKGDRDASTQQHKDTTVSKGAPEEYNRTSNCDLSLLTKKVQTMQQCRALYFLDPTKPTAVHKDTSKDKPLSRISRRPSSNVLKLLALQTAAK